MSDSSRLQKQQIREAIQSQIIPSLQRGVPWMLFDTPPQEISRGRPSLNIIEQPADALPASHGKGDNMRIRSWRDANLNALNVPYWGYVVEGEADLVMGITEKMCRERNLVPNRWIIELPAGTLFWIPPGIPLSMGGNQGIHWERPNPAQAYSRIFWMHVTPQGAGCHFCTTEKGQHWNHPNIFIPARDIWLLAQRITSELKSTFEHRQLIIEHLMRALLLYTLRGIDKQPEMIFSLEDITPNEGYLDHEEVIRKALAYIDENYHKAKLTVTEIAEYVHLSPTHLGRLFRKHLRCTVKETILNTRFERARALLEDSSYNIGQIGTHCGYIHSSSFIAAFEKRYGRSPSDYRREHSK